MTEPVFIVALSIVGIVMVTKTIAGAFSGRGASRSELAQIKERLDECTTALDDTQAALTHQSTQLAELQERVDFAERILAQARDRSALGAGDKRSSEPGR